MSCTIKIIYLHSSQVLNQYKGSSASRPVSSSYRSVGAIAVILDHTTLLGMTFPTLPLNGYILSVN